MILTIKCDIINVERNLINKVINMKRIFLTVLDSFGVGFLPDADKFGDLGANTLKSVAKSDN